GAVTNGGGTVSLECGSGGASIGSSTREAEFVRAGRARRGPGRQREGPLPDHEGHWARIIWLTRRSKKPKGGHDQPLADTERMLVEKKFEILRQASLGFTQDRLLHIQGDDRDRWTNGCTDELRRKIASVAPSHVKIALIHFRELGCISFQGLPLSDAH